MRANKVGRRWLFVQKAMKSSIQALLDVAGPPTYPRVDGLHRSRRGGIKLEIVGLRTVSKPF